MNSQTPIIVLSEISSQCKHIRHTNTYGVNDEGPLPEVQTGNNVVVLECEIVLTREQCDSFQTFVNLWDEDNEHGKLLYLNACRIIDIYVNQT